jgi:hypothetical protein
MASDIESAIEADRFENVILRKENAAYCLGVIERI